MVLAESRSGRLVRGALALLFVVLAAYGLFSTPALMMRWGPSLQGVLVFGAWSLVCLRVLGARRWTPAGILAFAAVALALRLGSLALAEPRVPNGDALYYLEIARNVVAGRGLVMHEPFMGTDCYALYPPVFSLVLAGLAATLGLSGWALLALNTAIDLGTAALIARLGARLDRPCEGRAAGALYLIWPSVLLSAPLAQKESLLTLLVMALALAWLAASRAGRRRWRHVATIGALAAVIALTQPGSALLAALFGLAFVPQVGVRRLLAIGVPAAAITVALLLPWWLRNYLVLGQFVPLTSASGYSLWIGNNPDATGNWEAPPEALRGMPELAFSQAAAALAKQWIVAHPAAFVRLTVTKFLRATAVGEFGLTRLAAMHPPMTAAIGAMLFPLAQGAHLLLLGGTGLALAARRNPAIAVPAALIAACVTQFWLFGVWFEFGERHRECMTPLLLLGAAIAFARAGAGARWRSPLVPAH